MVSAPEQVMIAFVGAVILAVLTGWWGPFRNS